MSGPISARISRFHNQYTFKEAGAEIKGKHQSGCGTKFFGPLSKGCFVFWARKTLKRAPVCCSSPSRSRTLRCQLLGEDTLLSQCLSPPRGIYDRQWISCYDGLASHPGGSGNTSSRFMLLQKPRHAPAVSGSLCPTWALVVFYKWNWKVSQKSKIGLSNDMMKISIGNIIIT